MNGRELYEQYQKYMAEQNVSIDDYEDLDGTDQVAWEKLAVFVS